MSQEKRKRRQLERHWRTIGVDEDHKQYFIDGAKLADQVKAEYYFRIVNEVADDQKLFFGIIQYLFQHMSRS